MTLNSIETTNSKINHLVLEKGLTGQVFQWEEFKVLVFTVANI